MLLERKNTMKNRCEFIGRKMKRGEEGEGGKYYGTSRNMRRRREEQGDEEAALLFFQHCTGTQPQAIPDPLCSSSTP
jgi:hypothetical protein